MVAIFLTEIFELATMWLKQSENFLKIASHSGGSDGAPWCIIKSAVVFKIVF
ncbi:hypothetical protein SC1083_1774 [Aggregatibacter actinomycetemcomitans serotype e str. SC1083]|uniref:Uncharacterized protein n=1 Tax=Aggregatibacter actinomycetemcomitans serotype e str. SC1083 TaxID=907488 RepID=G4AAA1_AGGAC|nr:hypothetical protein SC1083_1774 [Aggregatibacter actinomycetemcomitans serotype e str. SC1083]KYK74427.1 hypothetical protein SA3096_05440 [Aggregatibacter actinomycetemcomitans serotype e str. SA3096]KYK82609.1 hypothetical protein SC936_01075 [Aggregatibacter actinomycetemcomitans serotype e str. SC936]